MAFYIPVLFIICLQLFITFSGATIVSAQLTCLRCDKDKNEYCPEIFDEAKKGNVSRVQCDVACIKSIQDLQSE